MSANPAQYAIVCFGEVLWDILPTGALPGGAPMNVAYHLKKLGNNPAVLTKIGLDEQGKKLMELLSENGISTDYFQMDKRHSTGVVYAKPNEHNEVTYEIVNPVAWDFIEWKNEFRELLAQAKYFVYGSLTSRNKVSRDTLYDLLEIANTKVLDINLRPPHFHRSQVEFLLQKADLIKMNLAELELITDWFGQFKYTVDRIKLIQEKFLIDTIIITMGGDGAVVNDKGTIHHHTGYKVQVADTIGSGDAFLAGFLHQLLKGMPVEDALDFASGMGAFIATRSGACPAYEAAQIMDLIRAHAPQQI